MRRSYGPTMPFKIGDNRPLEDGRADNDRCAGKREEPDVICTWIARNGTPARPVQGITLAQGAEKAAEPERTAHL